MLTKAQPVPDDLLLRARAGNAPAFAEIVEAHQRSVFSIAYRMLNNRAQAEDLAQDVFLQLYRKLDAIESLEHLGFWLRRLPYTSTQPLDEGAQVAAAATDDDPLMSRELARLLGELAPAARAVMVLRYQEDRDIAEIATALDMPVNTVKSHIKRSLTALRSRMIGAKLITTEELS